MGGKSSSKSSSSTSQTWTDQRVAGTDDAVVVGSGGAASVQRTTNYISTDLDAIKEGISAAKYAVEVNKETGALALALASDTIAGALTTIEGARADNSRVTSQALNWAEQASKAADERQFEKLVPWVAGSFVVYWVFGK